MDSQYDKPESRRPWQRPVLAILALLLIGGGVYLALKWLDATRTPNPPMASAQPTPAAAPEAPAAAPPPAPPVAAPAPPAHPIEPVPQAAPLTLDDSDAAILAEIARLGHVPGVLQWLRPSEVIRHLVATVDAIPSRQVAQQIMPTVPVAGRFLTAGQGEATTFAAENAARYRPYVHLLASIDPKAAAGTYRNFYPLFQQAYRELGYPGRYFNDRLVEAIDNVLATPDVVPAPGLEAPSAMWRYTDANLEALSGGQKILLRMGRENAGTVKTWLLAFRAEIAKPHP